MKIKAIKTDRVEQPQDLNSFINLFLPQLEEKSIVVVTSKIVSLCEGHTISKNSVKKQDLIAQEAEKIIPNEAAHDTNIVLTYTQGLLIPSAGIDESNGNNTFILYPQDPFNSTFKLWQFLRKKHQLTHLGVIISDSHTTPLRKGVTGIALAWWGFNPTKSYVGSPDLFGHPLRVTHVNVADALAIAAVFTMGEGNECTPISIIQDAPHVTFNTQAHNRSEIAIDPNEDLYRPLLKPLLEHL